MAAVAVSLLPGLVLAQIPSGSVTSQSSVATSTLTPAVSAPLPNTGVSAPAGYTLIPNDQVAVEVYGENDLRTNGRLNGEGNLSVPLLGMASKASSWSIPPLTPLEWTSHTIAEAGSVPLEVTTGEPEP